MGEHAAHFRPCFYGGVFELTGDVVECDDEQAEAVVAGEGRGLYGEIADGCVIVLPNFRPAERGFKSRISRQCEPDSSLG